jgi:hypothetical protein
MSFWEIGRDLLETQLPLLFAPFIVWYFWSWPLIDIFTPKVKAIKAIDAV